MARKADGKYDWFIFVGIAIVLALMWYYSGLWIDKHITSSNISVLPNEIARGAFGDKFGAVTSLFTTLTFIGIIFAVLLQRRDLNQQRATIQEQSEIMAKQSFETGFFNLLEHHKNNIDQLELGGNSKRQSFKYFIELILQNSAPFPVFNVLKRITRDEIITIRDSGSIPTVVTSKLENSENSILQDCIDKNKEIIGKYMDTNLELHWKYLQDAYLAAHKRSGDALSHYFRTLYIIFKYIDDVTTLTRDQKKGYARIVRAQLSDDELLALFYNSLAKPDNVAYQIEFGFPKMTNFVHTYDILQNLNRNRAFHSIHWDLLDSCKKEEQVK